MHACDPKHKTHCFAAVDLLLFTKARAVNCVSIIIVVTLISRASFMDNNAMNA